MGLFRPTFKNFTMKDGHMSANIKFSAFGGRFRAAQLWLDREIMKDMRPLIPYRTGIFRKKIEANNRVFAGTGRIVTAVPPQGKWLYSGVTKSGKPIHYTNPQSVPQWGAVTVQQNLAKYRAGVKERLKGKGEGNE